MILLLDADKPKADNEIFGRARLVGDKEEDRVLAKV